ncbi:hypothetical protein Cgig2_010331 [Carnegiea gigantea]|uniref:CDT1 Geminin-binding domain-containing protein n=1 Tax=Carnegiea gigantea TaxID=171969 RepID=A0A9Q1K5W7_9CARY|nr:hypothetical protein Cgig2_010331 [Carnegiea gigantea]
MASIESKLSDESLKSPAKTSPELTAPPSDQISDDQNHPSWCIRTPQKLPSLPRKVKHRRPSELPEKYEIIGRFFDALVASLKLLRLRKSIPVFSKIRVMIESMSERRFTHQHLAQLKFLLPELGVRRVLLPDDETRCMKYDLHLTLNVNTMINTKKRKRGSKFSPLKDCFISRLLQFLRAHPEGTEVPEEEVAEPFNWRKHAPLLNATEPSCSVSLVCKSEELQPAQASHFSASFKKHFSKGDQGHESGIRFQSPSQFSLQSPSASVSKHLINEDESPNQTAVQNQQGPSAADETASSQNAKTKVITPKKLAGTPTKLTASTPALQTPKRCRMSPDDNLAIPPNKVANRPACARSLRFDRLPTNVNIELQVDAESSNILDILPASLLQSLKEKEERTTEQAKRKQMIGSLLKLFDRIYYLFQSPKSSALTREALIRDLTECHPDITDQSEVEQQLMILQETIPDWISPKLSPSGKILYRSMPSHHGESGDSELLQLMYSLTATYTMPCILCE